MAVTYFISIIAVVAIGLLASIFLFHKDKKEKKVPTVTKKTSKNILECSIREMSERIATEPLTQKGFIDLVDLVAKKHKFPGKSSKTSHQYHLEFVYQFCLNPRVNGATIVKMTNTLKALNGEYKKDIEALERKAVSARDH